MSARSPRFLLLLATPLLLSATAHATPILFQTGLGSLGGASGTAVFRVSGDFDGDGVPDVASVQVAILGGGPLAGPVVWSRRSAGAFTPAQPVAVPFAVKSLAAGDLDGDGRADLVACADPATAALAILHSNGAGFDAATMVPTDSAGVTAVTAADLDGDGDLDLVAANQATHRVDLLFNDGAGHFSGLTSITIPVEVSRTWVLDLNGDGKADILTGNWPQFLPNIFTYRPWTHGASTDYVLLGTGGGSFAAPIHSHVVSIIAVGSFSAPGAHDAVVADSLGYGVAQGLGDGTFGPPVYTARAWAGCGEPWACPIDLDGDGHDELLGGTGAGCTPQTYGVFRIGPSLALDHREVLTGWQGFTPLGVDLNGDGRQEALIATGVANNLNGRLGGTRSLANSYSTHEWRDVRDVDAADLDHDGAAEVVVSVRSGAGAMYHSRHDGTFDPSFPWQGDSYISQSLIVDLNGDGFLDVAHAHYDNGSSADLFGWLNDGTAHLASMSTSHLSGIQTPPLGAIVACDFDGDGDVDVLGACSPSNLLFTNDGTGHFTQSACSLTASGTYAAIPGETFPARFTTAGDSLVVEHGTGTGTLAPPVKTQVPGLLGARFADVDGDGRIDAVCLLSGSVVETLLGQPGGGWGAPIVAGFPAMPAGLTPFLAAIGDLDGDHRPDLLFTSGLSISVLRNLGGGAFGDRGDSFSGQAFGSVIADVDGDGAGDLVGIEPLRTGQTVATAVNVLMGIPAPIAATPALVSLSSAVASFDRASLAWFVPSDGPGSLTLERRRDGGAWSTIATVTPVAGRVTYEDRAVDAGVGYAWRLAWQEDGTTQHSDVATLAIPQRPRFAIAGVRPNPADGDRVSVSLTLDRTAPVDLAVVDVAGRIVASRRVIPSNAGRLDVALDGLSSLRPALYFVHAEQAGRRATTTLVRLH